MSWTTEKRSLLLNGACKLVRLQFALKSTLTALRTDAQLTTAAHQAVEAMIHNCAGGASQHTHASIVNRYLDYCKVNTLPAYPMHPKVLCIFFHDELGHLKLWDPTLSILNKTRAATAPVLKEAFPWVADSFRESNCVLSKLFEKAKVKLEPVVIDTEAEPAKDLQELLAKKDALLEEMSNDLLIGELYSQIELQPC